MSQHPDSPSPSRPPGLLVVDDEAGVRRVLALALERHGFAVWQASGGDEAVTLFARHRAAIDVVLLDVRMPDKDGPQTLFALRQLDPQCRAVFMSGNAQDYRAEDLLRAGASHLLVKPFPSLANVVRLLWQLAHPQAAITVQQDPPAPGSDGSGVVFAYPP